MADVRLGCKIVDVIRFDESNDPEDKEGVSDITIVQYKPTIRARFEVIQQRKV